MSMTPTTKILVGALGTAALATLLHGPMGFGQNFINGLGGQAIAKVADIPGVTAKMDTENWMSRGVVLSGEATAEQKAAKLAAAAAIPGMAWAKWADGGAAVAATPAAPAESPATAETVANCQDDVDAAIKGKTVQFETGTATLSPASLSLIEALAKTIADCAGTKVEVAGHTDITGGDVANLALSKARADSVVAALVAKAVPADRLVPVGYGENKPIDPAATPSANAVNRRIEFAVATAG